MPAVRGQRILVVDDEPAVRELMTQGAGSRPGYSGANSGRSRASRVSGSSLTGWGGSVSSKARETHFQGSRLVASRPSAHSTVRHSLPP